MDTVELAGQVGELLEVDAAEYRRRVQEDAEVIKEAIAEGVFDNPQAIIGLEYEFYAVSDPAGPRRPESGDGSEAALKRVPRWLLEFIRFEQELGMHNAELATSPLPLNADGLRAQEAEVAAQLRTANDSVRETGMRLVSDGMWTIPPEGETAREYLTASTVENGIRLASNMSTSPRYHAMSNANSEVTAAMEIDAPNVSLSADTVMPESLITSIQPHFQVSEAAELPEYFRYALRIAAPLLALGVNSPLFPPDLYDDVSPERILDEAWMGHRIRVFESVLNPADDNAPGKVRFPRDIETAEQAVDRIVEDKVLIPLMPEESIGFDDEVSAFRLKHGSYWRWVRPVFGGSSRSSANARIEFRPIAAQPTVRDSVAFQAMFAGLMKALPQRDHPVRDLDWERAERNFYEATESGLEADLHWITGDGEETTDPETMYLDLFEHAAEGLRESDLSEEAIGRYLGSLRRRVRYGITPARWKVERVRELLDEGISFEEAVYATQRRYVQRQTETLFDTDFSAWIEDHRYRVG